MYGQYFDFYVNLMVASNGHLVSVAALAKEASISWKVVKSIVDGYHNINMIHVKWPVVFILFSSKKSVDL